MQTIEASFVINTPMFLGGANPKTTAEIRISSIKSAIRFWWRALAYAGHDGDLVAMKAEEDEIFGSTSRQAQVRFSLLTPAKRTSEPVGNDLQDAKDYLGIRYLGYGVMTSSGVLERPCILGGEFTIRLFSKAKIDDTVISALKLFGLIGGLGSRSRKGFGSVTIQKLMIDNTEEDILDKNDYIKTIQNLTAHTKELTKEPEISAFYADTALNYLGEKNNPAELLGNYGLMMMHYRSSGSGWEIKDYSTRPPTTLFNSEKRFEKDHDWSNTNLRREQGLQNFLPKRTIFGLPHSYGQYGPTVKPQNYERRASPLFFHIHRLSKDKFAGIALILRSNFLPPNESINTSFHTTDEQAQYSFLEDFINENKDEFREKTYEEYFPKKKQILAPQEDKT